MQIQIKGFPNHKTVSSGSGSFLSSLGCVMLMNDFSSIVPFSRMDSLTLLVMGMDS